MRCGFTSEDRRAILGYPSHAERGNEPGDEARVTLGAGVCVGAAVHKRALHRVLTISACWNKNKAASLKVSTVQLPLDSVFANSPRDHHVSVIWKPIAIAHTKALGGHETVPLFTYVVVSTKKVMNWHEPY